MYEVVAQDANSTTAHTVDTTDTIEAAREAMDDLGLDMGVLMIDAAGLDEARALLDLDGQVVEAKWMRLPGAAHRTLVAVVAAP